jgi:hypothetical protein
MRAMLTVGIVSAITFASIRSAVGIIKCEFPPKQAYKYVVLPTDLTVCKIPLPKKVEIDSLKKGK